MRKQSKNPLPKVMKASSRKAKGSRLERDCAKDIRDAGLDKEAKRMPLSGAWEGLKSDIFTTLPVSFEMKNQESWSPLEYMKQAENGCRHGEMPIVVMSRNRLKEPLCLIKWNDLLALMKWAKDGGWLDDLPFSKRKIR